MKGIKIKKNDFKFDKFVDTLAGFIEENFGSDSPAETMRYFYSFDQALREEGGDNLAFEEFSDKLIELSSKLDHGEISSEHYHEKLDELYEEKEQKEAALNEKLFKEKNPAVFTDKDPGKWEMDDFKDAILKGGETIFFPFSSGLDAEGSVTLASGGIADLSDDDNEETCGEECECEEDEEELPSIGMTDCFGILVSLTKNIFIFDSAIAWGGMSSSIEFADHPKIDPVMKKFIGSFKSKKPKKITRASKKR